MKTDKSLNINLTALDDLFETTESREDNQRERLYEIELSKIHGFPNHPYHVKDDEAMNELVSSTFRVQQQRSLMTMNTALEYKYRPTLSYRVELERVPAQFLGTLKVSIRTQSSALSMAFMKFFQYWSKFESQIMEKHGLPYACAAGNNSFSRRLLHCPGQDCETQGSAISRYIAILDGSIKLFLADGDAFRERLPGIAAKYENLLDQTSI